MVYLNNWLLHHESLPFLVINGHFFVMYLRYHRFNHVIPVNRNCVVMSCFDMDVGNFHEIAFSMTVHFQCQSLKSSLQHTFY